MHRGWVSEWRKETDSAIWTMPPLYFKIWRYVLMTCDYETGILSTYLSQIAEGVAWDEQVNEAVVRKTPAKSHVHKILGWLEAQEMIKLGKNGQFTHITIINWAIYNQSKLLPENGKRTVKERCENGPPVPPIKVVQELKEVDSKTLPPDGGGQVATPPPPEPSSSPSKPSRKRTPKPKPEDDDTPSPTNPNIFLRWAKATYPEIVLVPYPKFLTITKAILIDRLQAGHDPQAEMQDKFGRFMAGLYDQVWPLTDGREKEMWDFLSNYAKWGAGNGKAHTQARKEGPSARILVYNPDAE